MFFFADYVHVLFRESPNVSTRVRDIPHFYEQTVFWSLIFCVLSALVTPISKLFAPKFYSSLKEKKKNELPSYVACLFHHFVVIPIGVYSIYQDFQRSDVDHLQYDYGTKLFGLVPFTFGYLIGDTGDFAMIIYE